MVVEAVVDLEEEEDAVVHQEVLVVVEAVEEIEVEEVETEVEEVVAVVVAAVEEDLEVSACDLMINNILKE